MGAMLKGLQAILVALGVIAVIGSGVILYYNSVKPEGTEEAAIYWETQPEETDAISVSLEETIASETEETAETSETENTREAEGVSDDNNSNNVAEGHSHNYSPRILKDATCTEAGQMSYTCACGDYYVEPVAPLDHVPGDWVTVRETTTLATGLRQKSCSICGKVLQEETLPMLPAPEEEKDAKKKEEDNHVHTYTYEVTEEATCTENGEKTYTCSICGSSYVTSIPATNHPSRQTIRTDGTCGEPGTVVCSCAICKAVISSDTLTYDHKYSDWTVTKEPTTSSKGTKTRTCSVCGKVDTKSIPRL